MSYQVEVIDRVTNKLNRWIKEEIHIGTGQDKSMNGDDECYQFSHIYDRLFAVATSSGEQHHSEEGNSCWRHVNNVSLIRSHILCQRPGYL